VRRIGKARRFARLPDAIHDQQHGECRRDHGHPEREPEIVAACKHNQHCEQRTEEGSDRIHRLAKAESGAAKRERRDIGDQSVAGRTAYSFADAVDETGDKYRPHAGRERKERLGNGGEAVPDEHQELALPEPIADRTGEDARDGSRGLRYAFDDTNRKPAGAEYRDEERRQKAVDDLGRGIHAQRNKPERDNRCRHGAKAGSCWRRSVRFGAIDHAR
jgi:hypothetical protein